MIRAAASAATCRDRASAWRPPRWTSPPPISTTTLSTKQVGPTDIVGGPMRYLEQADIDAAVATRQSNLLACYQRELVHNPGLHGAVTVELVIQSDGSVSESRLVASTLKSAAVEGCLLREFRAITFPSPKGVPFTSITHTLNFEKVQ